MLRTLALFLIVALTSTVPLLGAEESDNSEIVCAVTHSVECGNDRKCLHGSATDVNVPTIQRVHLGKKTISATDENGEEVSTSIDEMRQVGDRLILTGIEGDRSWSAVISINTGELTATIADHDQAFVLFGECTVL